MSGSRGPRPTIGVLADHITNEYQNKILSGVSDELREAGATVVYFAGGVLDSPDPLDLQRNSVYQLIDASSQAARIDGVLVLSPIGNHIGPAGLAAYCARFAPLPLCSLSVEIAGASSVLVDDDAGMRELLVHLVVEHRKRRVAFVRGPEGNVEAERRYRVYRDTLDRYGIAFDPSLVAVGDFNGPSGAEAVHVLCKRSAGRGGGAPPFEALVAANDGMALSAMASLQARGFDVPGQIAVGGFDDVEEARFATPPLTTVRQPCYDSGRRASRILLSALRREVARASETPPERAILATKLVLRESCGCLVDGTSPAPPGRGQHLDEAFVAHRRDSVRVGSFKAFVASRRGELVDAVRGAVAAEHARIASDDWAEPLVDAFASDVSDAPGSPFLAVLGATLERVSAAGGSLRAWHAVIGVLHEFTAAAEGDPSGTRRARDLLHRARILIGDLRERIQAQHRIRRERLIRTLYETSEALMTAFDLDALAAAIAAQLPRLEIPACALSVYEPDVGGTGGKRARPLFVCDRDRQDFDTASFAAHELAPSGWVDARPRTLIVQPFVFQGEQLGFGVFEMGPLEGVLYEGLREIISAAMKGAQLVVQVVEEEKRRQRAERGRLEEEMALAAHIQTSIVPKSLAIPGFDMAAVMSPATEVGGDYYDVLAAPGAFWIGIGDVAGHGLKTGLVMLMIQSVVAAIVRSAPRSKPSEIVRVLNAVLFENVRRRLAQDEHATLSLLRYDGDGRFVFAGAHEDIVVFRAREGRCECIATPGPWVGAVPELGASLVDSALSLGPADVMVLYTDGVTEAMDASGVQFGIERVCEIVERAGALPAAVIRDHLMEAVQRWTAKQLDDVSVVVVRRLSF